MSVNRETEQIIFDIAVNSLDWGSGFLDDEQVEALRRYAEHLGADVWKATPINHRPKYCPGHEWVQPWTPRNESWLCRHCGRYQDEDRAVDISTFSLYREQA